MTVKTSQIFSPEAEGSLPYPTFQLVGMPTSSSSTNPTKDTYFLRGTARMPSISFSPSPTTLATRRVSSRSQTPSEEIEFLKSIDCKHDCPSTQLHGGSLTPPLSATEILSPTVIAAREYYLNLGIQGIIETPPQSGSETGTPQRMFPSTLKIVTPCSGVPRRHSVAIEPYLNTSGQMNDLKSRVLEVWRRASATPTSNRETFVQNISPSRVLGNRERWIQKMLQDENNKLACSPSLSPRSVSTEPLEFPMETGRQIHNPLEPRYLGNIPFSYTTNKLREWGDVYLFNSTTADAFIRAIPIPALAQPTSPQLSLNQSLSDFSLNEKVEKGEDIEMSEPLPTPKQIVKVKVVPQCRNRKSFFMQKAFPIRKPATSQTHRINRHSSTPRYHLRHPHRDCQGTKVEALRSTITELGRRPAVPIHIEYALYRTPLLAAVLLCEHVKRGDTIEIPLPFPEAWEDVIEWVYTGNSDTDVSTKVRETVEYLGGRI